MFSYFRKCLGTLLLGDEGQGVSEYAIIMVLLALIVVVTVTASMGHPLLGCCRLEEVPRGIAPRVVFGTKPECARKHGGSENVITIKDSSRRRSLAPARRRGEENALVLLLRRNSRLEPPQPALPRSRNPSGRADRHPLPGKPRRGLLVRLFSRWAAELGSYPRLW